MNDTICAISTPYGTGGIAVLRISGPEATNMADRLFVGRTPLREARGGSVRHGHIQHHGEVLDEVVATVFRAPHSYTGEDTVELACHGSLYIQQTLLQWLTDCGCRMARAGEFTQRAFLNGRMDLVQAEAVADLIAAQTKAEKDLALGQLRGSVSDSLRTLRDKLLEFASLIELELDFADHEELEFANRDELQALAHTIKEQLHRLTESFRTGNAIRHGIRVAIVGAPNTGKSTLLNALLGEERAIVSDVQGTTRDTVEDTLVLNGRLFRLVDTAGIRQTDDRLEQLGIERSMRAAAEAQIVLELRDTTRPQACGDTACEGKTHIRIWNKTDLAPATEAEEGDLVLAAKSGQVDAVREALCHAAEGLLHTDSILISNARHYEALCRAEKAIDEVTKGLANGLSGEWLDMDLQDCLTALGEVTGQISSQEVLNNIFAHFCIGK